MRLYNQCMINYDLIQTNVRCWLHDAKLNIDPKLTEHPRACAELIETFIQDNLYSFIPDQIKLYSKSLTAKALADCSCFDCDDNYYAFDIKTHRMGKWGMPNVTSYKKLDKFYKHSFNVFVTILIDYTIDGSTIVPHAVTVAPIEQIPWKYLAVQGTLGQIQIINAEKVKIDRSLCRDEWLDGFYENVQKGIQKKITMLQEELEHFTVEA